MEAWRTLRTDKGSRVMIRVRVRGMFMVLVRVRVRVRVRVTQDLEYREELLLDLHRDISFEFQEIS